MSHTLSRLAHRLVNGTPWRGIYPTFAAAQAHIPVGKSIGYNSKSAADIFRTYPILRKRLTDYVTNFHLQALLKQGSRLFDFGGSVGIAYYVYKQYLSLPEDLRWLVYDVPAIVEVGRERALWLESEGLAFTTDFQDADGSDVLISAGTLQFIETPLAQMLASLKEPPPYLLINRVPTWNHPYICTLHTIGDFICPYQVFQHDEFIQSFQSAGYTLVDEWECPESTLSIRFRPSRRLHAYRGFYFAKSPSSVRTVTSSPGKLS